MTIALIPMIIIAAVVFVLPIIIGVYVYRDADRRGMNAILWALVAALAPSLIGFIIYMLVRGSYSNLRCPSCDAPVKDSFVVCPKCGTKLKPSCPTCSAAVEPDWKMCPKCASPLPEVQTDVHAPIMSKDKSIWKVLVILILIPVLVIGMVLQNLHFHYILFFVLLQCITITNRDAKICSISTYFFYIEVLYLSNNFLSSSG